MEYWKTINGWIFSDLDDLIKEDQTNDIQDFSDLNDAMKDDILSNNISHQTTNIKVLVELFKAIL